MLQTLEVAGYTCNRLLLLFPIRFEDVASSVSVADPDRVKRFLEPGPNF